MPTMPPQGSRLSGSEPHRARHMAESFGSDAERYDRARPRYPDALVRRIRALAPGPDVLDAGCGTGIAARQFQDVGCRVLGVEPDARMAEVAGRLGVVVDVARFEDWEPGGRRFDVVTAGQSWHWIDPVAGAVKAAQALRPGGRLVAFWNAFQLPQEVAQAFSTAYRNVVPDAPFDPKGMVRSAVDPYGTMLTTASEGIGAAGGFGEPERWRFDWEAVYTREAFLDQLPTTGLLTRLPPDELTAILREVGAAVDTLGGRFTMHYATVAICAARTGNA
ncbi:class I SAM-dependent methyltransferase [Streptomyces sp. NPDC048416]|uniref:class I SAM-dependent methyltransferase n=1 Tax=Streptomyces sp. NPDC048416 TaxID=3365546 RepID=UPI00371C37EA